MIVKWKCSHSKHYTFFVHPNSVAEMNIDTIMEWQEKCYQRISEELNIDLNGRIRMYLCTSPEEISQITGCPPCNGMTFDYDLIYAVYNEQIHCLGPHEDAHLFSYQIAVPQSLFLKEGFAMYFDGCYHGRRNQDVAKEWYRTRTKFSITSLKENCLFLQLPENISYPMAGAFTAWLIQKFGVEKYLKFYRSEGELSTLQSPASDIIDNLFARDMTNEAENGAIETTFL